MKTHAKSLKRWTAVASFAAVGIAALAYCGLAAAVTSDTVPTPPPAPNANTPPSPPPAPNTNTPPPPNTNMPPPPPPASQWNSADSSNGYQQGPPPRYGYQQRSPRPYGNGPRGFGRPGPPFGGKDGAWGPPRGPMGDRQGPPPRMNPEKLFEAMDTNHDGMISKAEFMDFHAKHHPPFRSGMGPNRFGPSQGKDQPRGMCPRRFGPPQNSPSNQAGPPPPPVSPGNQPGPPPSR